MRRGEASLPVMHEVCELAPVALELDGRPQAVAQGAHRKRAVLLRRNRLARKGGLGKERNPPVLHRLWPLV
eukprot:12805216-Alexandrium_andersonii.AAC.1